MTEDSDFVRAIEAKPDDDIPRLIYADWLDDRGESARAEFIRLQIELASIDEFDPRWPELTHREQALIREHGHRWKIPDLKARQEFRRGFIEHVWIRGDRLTEASPILRGQPLVRSLRISGIDRNSGIPARLDWLDRIVELDLTNNSMVRDILDRLLEMQQLLSLRSLLLRNVRLWPDDLQWLAVSSLSEQVERLDLSGNPLGNDGVAVLSAPGLSGLKSLLLRSNGLEIEDTIRESGFQSLARCTKIRRLVQLDLNGQRPGMAIGEFLTSRQFDAMERLDLSIRGDLADNHWVSHFADLDAPRLQRLFLSGHLPESAIEPLVVLLDRIPSAVLVLCRKSIDDSVIVALESSSVRDRIRRTKVME